MSLKDVSEFRGSPTTAITAANTAIKERGRSWAARPIEFSKADEDTLVISINWKPAKLSYLPVVTGTNKKEQWQFLLKNNHPTLCFYGITWYFGVI